MKRGFTLVEMLVVMGIIAILLAAVITGSTKAIARAQQARCQELVSNAATALVQLFQKEGSWPKALINARKEAGSSILDADAAFVLAKHGVMSLEHDGTRLKGYDRFGVVSPWAFDQIKRGKGVSSDQDHVPEGGTILAHTLRFALDLDGDGFIEDLDVGGQSIPKLRANAAVWCAGKDGKLETYTLGMRRDDCYSWTKGQVVE